MNRVLTALAAVGCMSISADAQDVLSPNQRLNVVSARAGLVNYVEGEVLIDDRPVKLSPNHTYESMKDNEVVRTRRGRAEMLLTPGVVLRMAEDSAVRLVSGSLTAPVLTVLEGDVLVEAAEIYVAANDGVQVRVAVGERQALLAKTGIYRFSADPAAVRVYSGRAEVAGSGAEKPTVAKKGMVLAMSGKLKAAKFDTDQTDILYRWASRRSSYIALANISAANIMRNGSSNFGFYGSGSHNGWIYNPYLGMMTFIPMNGMLLSPFGYRFYTPRTVYAVYTPPPSYGGGGAGPSMGGFDRTPTYNANYGYNTVGARSSGGMSSSSIGAGPAPSAPAAGGGDGGGSRSGASGVGRGSSSAGGRAQ